MICIYCEDADAVYNGYCTRCFNLISADDRDDGQDSETKDNEHKTTAEANAYYAQLDSNGLYHGDFPGTPAWLMEPVTLSWPPATDDDLILNIVTTVRPCIQCGRHMLLGAHGICDVCFGGADELPF